MINVPPPSGIHEWANNPNWEPQNQLFINQGTTTQGLASPEAGALYPSGRSSNLQIPNTQHMRMTLSDINMPSIELQLGSLYNSTDQASENSHPSSPIHNSVYDPKYEEMGLPLDPHMRSLLAYLERHRSNNDRQDMN